LLVKIGAVKVEHGVLTQGLVIALYNYMSQILVELVKMANLIITMTKAVACANRVQTILDLEQDRAEGESVDKIRGEIEFRDVSARYAGAAEASVEGISFHAGPGQTIGVIGGTGAGKTTLVNLIPRLYEAYQGQVLIDGVDVSLMDAQKLRSSIGIVPQKALLFHGTIRDNLCWGKQNATDQELWDALDTAQAADMVRRREGQLDAEVSQGGRNFSGGQRQRLTIARALVRKPAILILDDSASALDYATDAKLRQSVRNMPDPPTTFIVSQRAASVRFADLILVLDDGQLVGKGSHDELMETCPVYQEIYHSQFSKEVTNHA
jgi:ABC-type multidrug transport system fused ATPase/permease subunit